VTLRNHGATPLNGRVRVELPASVLLDVPDEQKVNVPAGGAVTLTWPTVVGRKQAIALQDAPPRAWLTLQDGRELALQFDDVWIRRWEAAPPLVTNLRPADIAIHVQNFLDKPMSVALNTTWPEQWQYSRQSPTSLTIPAAAHGSAGEASLSCTAVLKADAAQPPAVLRLPLRVDIGGKHFDGGEKLVETEKRRTWYYISGEQVVDELGKRYDPDIPVDVTDAKKAELWGVEWKALESDTLIDFPLGNYPSCYAVTNVRFPHAGKVTYRVRGEAKVQLYLAGKSVDPNKPLTVPANTWQPLVLSYQVLSKDPPSTELVFLDEVGKVIWEAEFSATVGKND